MAGNVPFHPAPNRALGELLPGWYDVPQNPIKEANWGLARTATLGEIMRGSYVVPQNPIVSFGTGNVLPIGVQPGAPGKINGAVIGQGVSGIGGGCGCGCDGGHGGCGGGMGDISTDLSQFWTDLTSGNMEGALFSDTIFGFPAWSVLAVGVVGMVYVFGGTGQSRAGRVYRSARRKASALAAA